MRPGRKVFSVSKWTYKRGVKNKMAPEVGLEPTTDRLTVDCSTIELLWNYIHCLSDAALK